jgi:UDP-N-acetylmuramoyl-tripeptide--D-alanyl-D-alanine ligase
MPVKNSGSEHLHGSAVILTLKEIQAAIAPATFVGEPSRHGMRPVGVSTDSRQIGDGELFVALRGEKFDGHDFVSAVESKALAVIVEEEWFEKNKPASGNYLVVHDSLLALQNCGRAVRRVWQKPVIAVAGSNGKTTTKELVYGVLAQAHQTHRTLGNLNNHIGVPLTLAALDNGHALAVIEVGTNHFGEIARLCEIAEPDLGLITNIGREHLEYFADLAGVARAELELFDFLKAHGGTALVNIDDPTLRTQKLDGLKTISYGFSEGAQIRGVHATIGEDGCSTFAVDGANIRVPIAGAHNAVNALAAVAVGLQFGVSLEQARAGIESIRPVSMRMQVERIGGVTFINDAYNANPESMRAALDSLMAMPLAKGGRRVAVLGDMLEMGAAGEAAHREIGEKINQLKIDAVFAFGPASRCLVDAVDEQMISSVGHFQNKTDICSAVVDIVRGGDVVLVKGSRGMKMEEVIEAFRRSSA